MWVLPRIDASTETHICSLDSAADDEKMYRSDSATWSGAGVKGWDKRCFLYAISLTLRKRFRRNSRNVGPDRQYCRSLKMCLEGLYLVSAGVEMVSFG
jgi:hypothetical protein